MKVLSDFGFFSLPFTLKYRFFKKKPYAKILPKSSILCNFDKGGMGKSSGLALGERFFKNILKG